MASCRDAPAARLEDIRLVSGHVAYGAHQRFGRNPIYITTVRNPIDRFVSTYIEFLTNEKSKYHSYAKRYDINGFLDVVLDGEVRGLWTQLHNVQCRLVCGEGDFVLARRAIETRFFLAAPFDALDQMAVLLAGALGRNDLILPRVHDTRDRRQDFGDALKLTGRSVDALLLSEMPDFLLHSYVQKAFVKLWEISRAGAPPARVPPSLSCDVLPPKPLRFMGETEAGFLSQADKLADRVIRDGLARCGSRLPRLLDIGCGYGRLAYGLRRARAKVDYRGFDILARHIAWLNEHFIAPDDGSRYRFDSSDIYSERYNPKGRPLAEADWPFEPASFDCLASLSLFTHLYEAELVAYVERFAACLVDGGIWVTTAFCLPPAFSLADDTPDALFPITAQVSAHAYAHKADEPLFVIAYAETFLLGLFARNGLEVIGQRKGSWLTKVDALEAQDWFVLRRRASWCHDPAVAPRSRPA